MINANVTLLIDLGNSRTRAELLYRGKYEQFDLSNKFVELPAGYVIPADYRNANTTVFKCDGSYIANGDIVDIEYERAICPSSLMNKYEQVTSKYSVSLIMSRAITRISADAGVKPSDIKWVFNLAVLLPPFEHENNELNRERNANRDTTSSPALNNKKDNKLHPTMEALLKSITSIQCISPVPFNVDVEIASIKVLPEGLVAYTAAMFELIDGKVVAVSENDKFKKGYLMILDIGAGTTDTAIVKDGKFMLSSKETFKKGGNMVEHECRRFLRTEHSYSPKSMERVVQEAILEPSGEHVELLLDKAKQMYAQDIVPRLKEYLENIGVSPRELKGLLVVGGGSLPAVRDGVNVSESMATPILDLMKVLAPQIELLTLKVNPRFANLEGLRIMSTMW